MSLPVIASDQLISFLTKILNTPSPTGMADEAIQVVREALSDVSDLRFSYNRKGGLLVTWPGEVDEEQRAVTAHVDTLGGMVKEIKSDGRLRVSRLGGLLLNGVETEGCTVFAANGERIRGSYMFEKASAHVYGAVVSETQRSEANMEIRLDERVEDPIDVEALGIRVGDFVAFDPRVEVNNDFIRSRFLDDKACVACLVSAIQTLHATGKKPKTMTHFLFSNYEEVGHGASAGIPAEVCELLVVDMAAVGEGQASDEFHTTICVKDSGGPYHHGFSNRLRQLADQEGIDYKSDIYPYYRSDGSAAWDSGADIRVALIGPGVDASHNYERTHLEALIATTEWVMAYLLSSVE